MDFQVDIAYAPFMERFQPFLLEVKKYDIAEGRPKLGTWIQVLIKNWLNFFVELDSIAPICIDLSYNICEIAFSAGDKQDWGLYCD